MKPLTLGDLQRGGVKNIDAERRARLTLLREPCYSRLVGWEDVMQEPVATHYSTDHNLSSRIADAQTRCVLRAKIFDT